MRKNKLLKIVIDTNLWISFVISNKLDFLDSLLYSRKIKLLFNKELLAKIAQTIQKPKLKRYFSGNAFEEMLFIIEPFVDLIEATAPVNICRDPNDDFLLASQKPVKPIIY